MGGGGGGAVNLPFNTSLISSAVDFGVGCLIPCIPFISFWISLVRMMD